MPSYTYDKPFRFWCQTVLPLVYDDSLSYYELLCKVVTYLNNMIEDLKTYDDEWESFKASVTGDVDRLERLYLELSEYVRNYFSNMDVQEEINNKIDEMVTSGELDNIISLANMNNTGDSITLHRSALFFTNNERFMNTPTLDNMFSQMQGGCAVGDNLILAYTDPNNTEGNTTRVKLVKFDTNYAVVSSNIININHANSLCYNGHEIVATNQNNILYVIDPATLSIIETKTISDVTHIYDLCYDSANERYIASDHTNFYFISSDFVLTDTVTIDYDEIGDKTVQDLEYINGYIYALRHANYMMIFKPTGERIKTYNIGVWNNKNLVGETEFIAVWHGKTIIGSCGYCGVNSQYEFNEIFEFDLFKGAIDNSPEYLEHTAIDIYVDSSYTGIDSDGSSTKPYKNLQFAVAMTKNPLFKNRCYVHNTGNFDDIVSMDGCENVDLILNTSTSEYTIKALRLSNCSNIVVHYAKFIIDATYNYLSNANAAIHGDKGNNINISNMSIVGEAGVATTVYASMAFGDSTLRTSDTCSITNLPCPTFIRGIYILNYTITNGDDIRYASAGSGAVVLCKQRNKIIAKPSAASFVSQSYLWDAGTNNDAICVENAAVTLDQWAELELSRVSNALRKKASFICEGSHVTATTEAFNNYIGYSFVQLKNNVPYGCFIRVQVQSTVGIKVLTNIAVDLTSGTVYHCTEDNKNTYPFIKLRNIYLSDF